MMSDEAREEIEALRRERDDLNTLATAYGERIEQLERHLSVEKDAADFWHRATENAWTKRDTAQAKLQRAREALEQIATPHSDIPTIPTPTSWRMAVARKALADLDEGGDDAKAE